MAKNEFHAEKPDWLVKAYNNHEFLNSPGGRQIRILTEMTEPAQRLRRNGIHNTVVFFGSARTLSRRAAQKNLRAVEVKAKRLKATKAAKDALKQAINDLEMSRYYEDAALLSAKLTKWFNEPKQRRGNFVICSGGGPGIMEAANLGAKRAGGKSVGLNISLPMEQYPNEYQTKELAFEFHYFFIRKFWFFYLAKALVIFPGGFGTLDEFFELLTLIQTRKTKKFMPVVMYGREYWEEVLDLNAMAKWGMIDKKDLKLFTTFSSVEETFQHLTQQLTKYHFHKHIIKP
jgi:hypothetical protein